MDDEKKNGLPIAVLETAKVILISIKNTRPSFVIMGLIIVVLWLFTAPLGILAENIMEVVVYPIIGFFIIIAIVELLEFIGKRPAHGYQPPRNEEDIQELIKTANKDNLDNQGVYRALIVDHEDEISRQEKFEILKSKAKVSLVIMGIGLTNIDPVRIKEKYLDRGINVQLLIMNPEVLFENFDFFCERMEADAMNSVLNKNNVLLKNDHFDKYLKRDRYFNNVRTSFDNLSSFVLEYQKDENTDKKNQLGTLSMRVFNSFIPMSLTAINVNTKEAQDKDISKEFIVEFLLPFSSKRIMIHMTRKDDERIYNSFIDSIKNLSKDDHSIDIKDMNKK